MSYYAPKKSVPIFPLLIVPIILIIAFTYVNFSPYSSNSYSILDFLISTCYLLLWGLLFYFTWKSNSVFVSSVYCGIWILCFIIILITFLTDPSIKDSLASGFFSTQNKNFMDSQYGGFYDVDLGEIKLASTLAILPLIGVCYLVRQFCANSTAITVVYITMLCTAFSFLLITIILIRHSLKMRIEEKKNETLFQAEEEEYKRRHKYE